MYHALLANRYLTTRVIPLIAVAAVALCVALVIIVVSVMTGFLNMVRSSGQTLMGDVVVSYPVRGIPHYERLLEMLRAEDAVAAATPVVDSWGLLKMPYPQGPHKQTETVQIWGIEPESFSAVTGFAETLYWKPLSEEEAETARAMDSRRQLTNMAFEDGLALHDSRSDLPGIVLGMHVSEGNERQEDGTYEPMGGGFWWMLQYQVTLTTLPIGTEGGLLEPESTILQVVNEFVSGVFLIDDTRVMIPIETAQRMLHLDEAELLDEDAEEVIGKDPARATMVLVRAVAGVSPDELRKRVASVYSAFFDATVQDRSVKVFPPAPPDSLPPRVLVQTWEQQQARFIGPVEKERELMRTLFSLIYVVCACLVLAIFWAIVYEKTRDIGILRSVGASRLGISWIFLRYGFVVGVFGAVLGLGLAYLVVHNINAIHDAMGNPPRWLAIALAVLALVVCGAGAYTGRRGKMLPIVLSVILALPLLLMSGVVFWFNLKGLGVVIWDPQVYYFTEIPNEVDYGSAVITMCGAVVFSVVGAFLPAAKAADTDPVKALRYE